VVELLQLHNIQLALLRNGLQRVAPPDRVGPHLQDANGMLADAVWSEGLTCSWGSLGRVSAAARSCQNLVRLRLAFGVKHEREESEGTVDRMGGRACKCVRGSPRYCVRASNTYRQSAGCDQSSGS